MAKFELKAPFNLGGQTLSAGIHEIDLVKDWFVDEMIHLGLIIELDNDKTDVVPEVVEEVKPKKGKKANEVVEQSTTETGADVVPEVVEETQTLNA